MENSEIKAFLEECGARLDHVGILSEDIHATIESFKHYPFVGEFVPREGYFGKDRLLVGEPYTIIIANGYISNNDMHFEILQPVRDKSHPDNIYSVLLDKYGQGLSHIAYDLPDIEAFHKVTRAFWDLGYKTILQGVVSDVGSTFIYLDPDNGSNVFLEFKVPPPKAN
jgi:4-hydroxyphenylpyruvate dioxygenase-like putative hemolysin